MGAVKLVFGWIRPIDAVKWTMDNEHQAIVVYWTLGIGHFAMTFDENAKQFN